MGSRWGMRGHLRGYLRYLGDCGCFSEGQLGVDFCGVLLRQKSVRCRLDSLDRAPLVFMERGFLRGVDVNIEY